MILVPTLEPIVDAPRRVEIPQIDRALTEVARAASERPNGPPLTRACTLTLVAYAPSPATAEHLGQIAVRTAQRHPARVILLVDDPELTDPEAWVTAHCQRLASQRLQLCCEEITIRTPVRAHARIPSIVRHLVLADMPVVLFWPAPVTWEGLFQELLDVVDRVVLDSATFPDAAAGLQATARFATGPQAPVAASDLNWGRLTMWRGLTAHFFDPPYTSYLDRLQRARVTYAAPSRAQALLYAGWLAGRLRWGVERPFARTDQQWRARLAGPGTQQIAVELHGKPREEAADGSLLLALLTADEGQATFSIVTTEARTSLMAVAELGTGIAIRRVLPLESPDETALLSAELDVLGHDRVYEGSLRAAAGLLGSA